MTSTTVHQSEYFDFRSGDVFHCSALAHDGCPPMRAINPQQLLPYKPVSQFSFYPLSPIHSKQEAATKIRAYTKVTSPVIGSLQAGR